MAMMKKNMKRKILAPAWMIIFTVALIVCVSFSNAETKSRHVSDVLTEESPDEGSKNLLEKFGDQLGKFLEKAEEFWVDEPDDGAQGKGFGLDLDLGVQQFGRNAVILRRIMFNRPPNRADQT